MRVFRACGLYASAALDVRNAAPRTNLCHMSNRSPARRNGNSKMTSRDWRPNPTGPGPEVWKLRDGDSGTA
jgi:hypothetical protein